MVEIIVGIKKQEKDQIDRATKGSNEYRPPNVNLSNVKQQAKFSSLDKNWSNPKPNIPRR